MWAGDYDIKFRNLTITVALDDGWELNEEQTILEQKDYSLSEMKIYKDKRELKEKEYKVIFRSFPELKKKLLRDARDQFDAVMLLIDTE